MTELLSPRLRTILSDRITPSMGHLGQDDTQKTVGDLKNSLFVEASNTTKMFYAALGMIIAVFVVMLYLLLVNSGNTTVLVAVSSASGVSISGLVWFAVRVAREATQVAILIALAAQLSSENALAAMQAVLKQQEVPSKNSNG